MSGPPKGPCRGAGAAAIYRDVRDRVSGYRILVPDGVYAVTLKFCETEFDTQRRPRLRRPHPGPQDRRERGSSSTGPAATSLSIWSSAAVEVKDGRLVIDFVDRIHYPSLAGIVDPGRPAFAKKINCGGPQSLDYDADWPETPRFLRRR